MLLGKEADLQDPCEAGMVKVTNHFSKELL